MEVRGSPKGNNFADVFDHSAMLQSSSGHLWPDAPVVLALKTTEASGQNISKSCFPLSWSTENPLLLSFWSQLRIAVFKNSSLFCCRISGCPCSSGGLFKLFMRAVWQYPISSNCLCVIGWMMDDLRWPKMSHDLCNALHNTFCSADRDKATRMILYIVGIRRLFILIIAILSHTCIALSHSILKIIF